MRLQALVLTFTLFVISPFILLGQYSTCLIYDKHGKLVVDSSFSISPEQYRQWILIEDLICTRILTRIKYPDMMLDNGVGCELITSFTIDSLGKVNNLRLEKYLEDSIDEKNTQMRLFLKAVFSSIIDISGDFKMLSVSSGGRYYLPFYFEVKDGVFEKGILNHKVSIIRRKNEFGDYPRKEKRWW